MSSDVLIDYRPTERQALFHGAAVPEVLYGGAAGGGKSRCLRAEALAFALQVPGSRQLIVRRTWPMLASDMVPKLRAEIPREVGTYNEVSKEWRLVTGSVIQLGYVDRDADVIRYQGAEYQRIYVDEATQFSEYIVRYLTSRLRAGGALADAMAAARLTPGLRLTANPGGVGHEWVKRRYIDPAPPGRPFTPAPSEDEPRPGRRLYIPARVTDNPHLDTSYIDRLDNLDPDTRAALRDGDWDAYQGAAFKDWRRHVHVRPAEDVARLIGLAGGIRAVGVDYGMDAPFAALWGARLGDGLIVIYREQYRTDLTPEEQATLIRSSEAPGERGPNRPIPVYLDPSTWARSPHAPRQGGGPTAGDPGDDAPPPGSIAAAYRTVLGAAVVKARNDRLAGIALFRDKLRVRGDGAPRLIVSDACVNLIRTIPALPRDIRRPEDIDTNAEDHAWDACRYLLMGLEGHAPRASADPTQRRPTSPVTIPASDIATFQF